MSSSEARTAVAEAVARTTGAGTARLHSYAAAGARGITWGGLADLNARAAWLTGILPPVDTPEIGDLREAMRKALGEKTARGLAQVLEGLRAISEAMPLVRVVRARGAFYLNNRQDAWEEQPEGWRPLSKGVWTEPSFLGPAEDPLWLLDILADAYDAVSVEAAPPTEPSAHYKLTIDAVRARVPPPLQAIPAELWLDESGRIRRMATGPTQASPRGAGRVTELNHFGIAVTIRVPDNLTA
jgi:hypothetical protein